MENVEHPNTPRENEPSAPFTDLAGKKVKIVGNYTLGKKLGRGSFCKVRLATHIQTGLKYAIKIMKPTSRKHSWVDIEREIKIISGLSHPNIVALHDILYTDADTNKVHVGNATTSFQNAKKLFLVVDLANNGELFEHIIERKRLAENEARFLFRQIIGAVEYMHAHCVAHRDLKPENILLDTNNTVKLNDFGLSNFVQPEKRMKTFCGSPVYAAPEVMRKSYYDGVVADVWSLGVILFTMVTGCLPWKLDMQTNRIENIEDLLAGRFHTPSALSPECASLLHKMLIPDPAQRSRINEVRKHPWVNKGFMDYPPRYLEPNTPVTEIDKTVLKQMEAMGYMQTRVTQDVFGNKNKPSVTIYHTLLRRRNLLLLINSTPATRAQPIPNSPKSPRALSITMPSSPTGASTAREYKPSHSPTTLSKPISPSAHSSSPSSAGRSKPSWTPMEPVKEDEDVATASLPPTVTIPSSEANIAKWVKDLTNVKTVPDGIDFRETRNALPTTHTISNFLKRRHSIPETQQELRNLSQAAMLKKDKSVILNLGKIFSWRKTRVVGIEAS